MNYIGFFSGTILSPLMRQADFSRSELFAAVTKAYIAGIIYFFRCEIATSLPN